MLTTQPVELALIGAGSRGELNLGYLAKRHAAQMRFVGVAERDDERRRRFVEAFRVPSNQAFDDWEAFFAAPRMADAVVIALPLAGRWALDQTNVSTPVQLVAPAQLAPGWALQISPPPELQPAFDNPSARINAGYALGDQRVGVYVGYYRQQNYDRKLVSSQNVLVTSKDPVWAEVTATHRAITFDNQPVTLREAELRQLATNTGERLTVWQVYWVNGSLTASNARAKLQGALQRLLGRGDDAAVVVLYTAKGTGDEGAQRLQTFVQANGAQLLQVLRTTQHTQP